MSRFKRPFLSPNQFYKSPYANPLGELSLEHKQERLKIESPVSGLHFCCGPSEVCDNIEISKENNILKFQQSSAINRTVIASDDRLKVRRAESGKASSGIEEGKLREPLHALHDNVSAERPSKLHSEGLFSAALLPCTELNKSEERAPLRAPGTPNRTLHVWDDDPDCDAAPASSWSALANRSLLCRPLPPDVGRCACYILHEREAGTEGPVVYSLYTDEGHGRHDRKLAVARHRRKAGRSEFVIGQNGAGTSLAKFEDGFLGKLRANLVGSRYFIWDEACSPDHQCQSARQLLGVVMFEPTITTLTGMFRVMRVYVPKYQSLQMSNTIQHEQNGLAKDWEENVDEVHELCSRKPHYNTGTRRYELDFRDRIRCGSKIRTSSKNFQLIMEEHGKQVILLHGKVGKSKYVMEYCFPLTAFQAFGICLASIDSKLCCSV